MFCEMVQAPGKENPRDHAEADRQDDDENDEIESRNEPVARMADKFSSTRMGQMLIGKLERTLRVIEVTAKWSLPQEDPNAERERPLPWFFFLLLIMCLRIFRMISSIGCYTVGAQPSTANSMVYYLQTKRRRLRALRVQGLKTIRKRKVEASGMCGPDDSPKVMGKFGTLISRAICMPGLHGELLGRYGPERDVKYVNDVVTRRSGKRRRDDDDLDMQNLTVSEMLDKYGNEDSENDSDYVPPEGDPDTSTSSGSTLSAEETAIENKYSDPEAEANKTEDDAQDLLKDEETESAEETRQIEKSIMEMEKRREVEIEPEMESGTTKIDFMATEKQKKEEIKEKVEIENSSKSKPVEQDQNKIFTTADSDNEQMHTPKEKPDANGGAAAHEIDEVTVAVTEVAPENFINTPRTSLNQLAFPLLAENTMKSTPGHESAATEKPLLTAPINIGSLQDFHAIFHPTLIEKVAPTEAPTSTSRETEAYESSTSDTPEPMSSGNQKKSTNPSNHSKHYYYNSKNRNKFRR